MQLEVLPSRTAGAAENMAVDFLLLQRYPRESIPRFRAYAWRSPAFTFGYSQKIGSVRDQLPPEGPFDLCRRPTGGGIVDHRDDWTYALVIPRGHPLEEVRATESYRAVHQALAETLQAQHVAAELQLTVEDPAADPAPGVCFERAEIYDVIDSQTGSKIAGAAQKRNKRGLLFQGSVARSQITTTPFDWELFEHAFVTQLAKTLGGTAESVPWPDIDDEEVSGLTDQYASSEWIERR